MPGHLKSPPENPSPKVTRGLRRFRMWEKKRGSHSTSYTRLGGAGETLFFAALFLLGVASLSALIVPRVVDLRGTDQRQASNTAEDISENSADRQPAPAPFDWGLWLGIPMFGSLVIAGAVGALKSAICIGTSAERRAAMANRANASELLAEVQLSPKGYPCVPKDTNWRISPGVRLAYRLPIATSTSWRLTALACFCLAWNGTVAVLAVVLFNQNSTGGDDSWIGNILAAPFFSLFGLSVLFYAAVGVIALHRLLKGLLAATAIGPTSVEVSLQPFRPGQSYEVFLSQAGHLRVNWLELRLVSDEEVSFSDGTDTRCETCRVLDQLVFRRENFEIVPSEPFQHGCSLEFPAEAMHSFSSAHNSVSWRFVVRGNTRKWPTFERVFPLIVYPSVPETVST